MEHLAWENGPFENPENSDIVEATNGTLYLPDRIGEALDFLFTDLAFQDVRFNRSNQGGRQAV